MPQQGTQQSTSATAGTLGAPQALRALQAAVTNCFNFLHENRHGMSSAPGLRAGSATAAKRTRAGNVLPPPSWAVAVIKKRLTNPLTFFFGNKKGQSENWPNLLIYLVALQGFEPRTCGL